MELTVDKIKAFLIYKESLSEHDYFFSETPQEHNDVITNAPVDIYKFLLAELDKRTPSPSACKASPSGCKSESGEKVIAAADKAVFSVRVDSENWHRHMSEEAKLDVANLATLLTQYSKDEV